jgi:predicted ATP-dependent serine protease
MADGFTCPRCGMTSHNRRDMTEGYCSNCHDWTGAKEPDDLIRQRQIARAELAGDPEWKGLIAHARACLTSRWCSSYVEVFDEVRQRVSSTSRRPGAGPAGNRRRPW